MTKTLLLATAALVATAAARAAPPIFHAGAAPQALPSQKGTIIDQTSGSTGIGIVSQRFDRSVAQYDSRDADAFTLKSGATITTVVAGGIYFNGSGPASSENVAFYNDHSGRPGDKVANCTYPDVKGSDNAGTFTITLPSSCKLGAGTFWVSVRANLGGVGQGGEWGWYDATETGPYQADWRNPRDGFFTGCKRWGVETTCVPAGQNNGKYFQLLGQGS